MSSGLYVLNQFKESIVAASSVDLSLFHLWHSRLVHVSPSRLNFVSTRVMGTLDSHNISS